MAHRSPKLKSVALLLTIGGVAFCVGKNPAAAQSPTPENASPWVAAEWQHVGEGIESRALEHAACPGAGEEILTR